MQQSRMFSRFALEKVRGFAHPEKIALTKIGTAISCRLNFLSAMYCIATVKPVLSATQQSTKIFWGAHPEQIASRRSRRSVARPNFIHIQLL
jgi:hypothetical protein